MKHLVQNLIHNRHLISVVAGSISYRLTLFIFPFIYILYFCNFPQVLSQNLGSWLWAVGIAPINTAFIDTWGSYAKQCEKL